MGIRVRFLQLRLAPCMSVGERYEVGAGERAEGSKGTTTLSAAVQDQVSRLSPPGLRQQGDFHLGHAAREEHAEGQKMLARLDSAIASLMQHKDDQKEAQRREDGCAAEDRGGSPQQAVEEACSVRLGGRELDCTLAGKAAGRCASAAGDASGNTGARRTRGEGNAGTGRTCPSSGAVPLERMAFRVFFLLLVEVGASLMTVLPPPAAQSCAAWTASVDSLATYHSLGRPRLWRYLPFSLSSRQPRGLGPVHSPAGSREPCKAPRHDSSVEVAHAAGLYGAAPSGPTAGYCHV